MIKIDLLAETRLGPTPVIGGDTSHDTPEHLTKKYIINCRIYKKEPLLAFKFFKMLLWFFLYGLLRVTYSSNAHLDLELGKEGVFSLELVGGGEGVVALHRARSAAVQVENLPPTGKRV
jgi:hypothetical protein